MRTIQVIGIGAGSPAYMTQQAIERLQECSVVVALDKGENKQDLLGLREEILARYAPDIPLVQVLDPPRDRHPEDYQSEVRRWHAARAELLADAIKDNSGDDEHVGFLVWGDPSLYDSTLRIVERMQESGLLEARVQVTPGITAIQVLTAQFGIVLNQIGQAIHITTGRNLAQTSAEDRANCVVMLDGGSAWEDVATEDTYLWWGAFLGMPEQVLREGYVSDIGAEVAQLKRDLRAQHGWIMDTYLLRDIERK